MTISNTPPTPAITAINSGVARVIRRVEIYESDALTLWTPPNGDIRSRLVSGNISLDYTRSERRTLDLVLDNSDSMLSLGTSEGFWYNKIIKAYRGVRYRINPVAPHYHTTDEWETQVGEFMIDRLDDEHGDATIKLTGRDYTKKCMTSKLEYSVSFDSGTHIYTILRALASNAGISKLNIPFTNDQLAVPLDAERGTERWSIMVNVANTFGYDLFFDNRGYLTMKKFPDPAVSPSLGRFSTGVGGNLVTLKKSTNDSRLYNHIVVYGNREAVEGGEVLMPYFGEAKNEDPNSPTSIQEIGDRYFPYESSFFTDNSQCVDLARAWLNIYSLESYEMDWSSIVYPWFDVGNVVELQEPNDTNYMRLLMDTLNIPLGLEPMSATGKRVLMIG